MTITTDAARGTSHAMKLAGLIAGLAAILTVLLALFILPSLKSGPHGLPVGMVGASSVTQPVKDAIRAGDADAYDFREFDTRADLVAAVESREVNGGYVVTDRGLEAVVASAGSTAISGSLNATANMVGKAMGLEVTTADVVPLPEDDPTGIGIGGLAFPLVFGGIVPAVAVGALFAGSHGWKIGGLAGFAVVGGLVVAAVLRFWFGSIEHSFWPVAASMALGIAALALPLAGLQQFVGGKGFTIGAASMMFLGNPLAGIATTGAWLPTGLGTFGQLLPPGASGSLVRSAAYFDGAGSTGALVTLIAWVVVGLALYTAGAVREARGNSSIEAETV